MVIGLIDKLFFKQTTLWNYTFSEDSVHMKAISLNGSCLSGLMFINYSYAKFLYGPVSFIIREHLSCRPQFLTLIDVRKEMFRKIRFLTV
jgi:hypothetical protein